MPLAGEHAVLARPGVVGDEHRQRVIGAFDEAHQTLIVDLRTSLGYIVKETCNRVGDCGTAAGSEELPDFVNRTALLNG